jgi:hypothetical protein
VNIPNSLEVGANQDGRYELELAKFKLSSLDQSFGTREWSDTPAKVYTQL